VIARAAIVLVMLAGAGLYSAHASSVEAVVPRVPLASLPLALGDWHGREAAPLADDVLAQLGVDDYVNRQYARAGAPPVGIYVGYYASQRQGDTIHSPQNCLPGAGWLPIETAVTQLRAGDRSVPVNRFVIQKALDRQVVLYWYQGRGRVTASEYANKVFLMLDAARLHRTNGGLVRLITPVVSSVDAAKSELAAFAGLLFARLDQHLP
jgi:EpsI family protein